MERTHSQKRPDRILQIASRLLSRFCYSSRTLRCFRRLFSARTLLPIVWHLGMAASHLDRDRSGANGAGVRFTKQNLLALAIVIVVVLGFYAYSIATLKIHLLLGLCKLLPFANRYGGRLSQVNGFFVAVTGVIKRTWYYAYSSFINIFLAVPVRLCRNARLVCCSGRNCDSPDAILGDCDLPETHGADSATHAREVFLHRRYRACWVFPADPRFPGFMDSRILIRPDSRVFDYGFDHSARLFQKETKYYLMIVSLTVMIIGVAPLVSVLGHCVLRLLRSGGPVRLIQGKQWTQLKRW
ncbi:MAG: hypothetical protein R2881_03115 [Eubacteriales bacterium]